MGYYELLRGGMFAFKLRLEMVKRCLEVGVSQAAREFKTTRKTVRKWMKRYKEKGLEGLKDLSRAPHHIRHKTPPEKAVEIIGLRREHPSWGPDKLKSHYGIDVSQKTIGRIIREAGLVRRKKKSWRKKRDLREAKKRLKAFEFIEIDVKDLSDIGRYWVQMRGKGLPRYQFTARDVRTGGKWYCYGRSRDSTNAAVFLRYLVEQLKRYGVDLSRVRIQTDNGSEFIGSSRRVRGESGFEKVLREYGIKHVRIPPCSPTWQSDVEAVHKIIEDEFYEVEEYRDGVDFLAKAYAYGLYFNFRRKNRYRGYKTPVEILHEVDPEAKLREQVFNLPPVILDHFVKDGYYVRISDIILLKKS